MYKLKHNKHIYMIRAIHDMITDYLITSHPLVAHDWDVWLSDYIINVFFSL